MSESNQRRDIVKLLKPFDAIAVENGVGIGTPDVNGTFGWIELKQLRAWPTTIGLVVRIDHFTQEQRIWLKQRWAKGGGAWLLLRVRTEWLLFEGHTAARVVGRATREELHRDAIASWSSKRAMEEELSACLSRPRI